MRVCLRPLKRCPVPNKSKSWPGKTCSSIKFKVSHLIELDMAQANVFYRFGRFAQT